MKPETLTIPAGYRADASGRLVPESMIKPIDRTRDELVRELADAAKNISGGLAKFKANVFAEIGAFQSLSAEQYNVKFGGKKGNVTLYSFDGAYKIQVAIADSLVFDERLQAAKHLIDECFREWTVDSRPEIRALIDAAFAVDKEGNINTARVLGLRKMEIKDQKWLMAMKAIAEAVTVVGSTQYVRVYERVGDTERYAPIVLDLAGV